MRILTLTSDADEYRTYLAHLDCTIDFATSPDAVDHIYDILLAQPDLAAEYLKRGGTPQWIQSTWAGVTPLLDSARSRDITVTGVKGVFGQQIAEYVFAYLLEDIRDTRRSYTDQLQRTWQPFLPGTLRDRHLVIAGTGSIGQHIARTARSFAMRVTGVSRTGTAEVDFDQVHPATNLAEIVQDADYLLLVLPDTRSTHNLIDNDVLNALPPHAMLINVGRGATLDTAAVLDALSNGRLRRAVLDVFPEEPLSPDSELWLCPNLVITPHIAAESIPADIAAIFLRNLDRYREGRVLEFTVDLQQGY